MRSFGGKGSLTDSINYEGVCRTALAAPDLLKSIAKKKKNLTKKCAKYSQNTYKILQKSTEDGNRMQTKFFFNNSMVF